MSKRRVVVSVAVTMAAAVGVWDLRGVAPRQVSSVPTCGSSAQSVAPSPAYAPSNTCESCHEEIARTYALTGMGRSVARLGPGADRAIAPSAKSRTFYHKPSDRHYSLVERDGIL